MIKPRVWTLIKDTESLWGYIFKIKHMDLPDSPMIRTPSSQVREHGFDP